jgi:hypothetical protein
MEVTIRLSTSILVLANMWIKIRGDKLVQEAAISFPTSNCLTLWTADLDVGLLLPYLSWKVYCQGGHGFPMLDRLTKCFPVLVDLYSELPKGMKN